jgi:hypothetical protein
VSVGRGRACGIREVSERNRRGIGEGEGSERGRDRRGVGVEVGLDWKQRRGMELGRVDG